MRTALHPLEKVGVLEDNLFAALSVEYCSGRAAVEGLNSIPFLLGITPPSAIRWIFFVTLNVQNRCKWNVCTCSEFMSQLLEKLLLSRFERLP